MTGELQTAFERLTNQARFVQMIVDKKLNVSGCRKTDTVIDLRKHEFRPVPKKKQAKESAETEETLDVDGNDTDFDYLLGMPIYIRKKGFGSYGT